MGGGVGSRGGDCGVAGSVGVPEYCGGELIADMTRNVDVYGDLQNEANDH